MSLNRRELVFNDLDEVVRDVESLRANGYERAGNWNLAQICGHLTDWIRYPLDGYPSAGCVMGPLLWLMKITIGKSMKRKILATGKFKAGEPTMKNTIPPADLDEAAAVAKLTEVVKRDRNHRGELHPSPLFGRMTRDEFTRLHLIHCAHHLSFLIPKR